MQILPANRMMCDWPRLGPCFQAAIEVLEGAAAKELAQLNFRPTMLVKDFLP